MKNTRKQASGTAPQGKKTRQQASSSPQAQRKGKASSRGSRAAATARAQRYSGLLIRDMDDELYWVPYEWTTRDLEVRPQVGVRIRTLEEQNEPGNYERLLTALDRLPRALNVKNIVKATIGSAPAPGEGGGFYNGKLDAQQLEAVAYAIEELAD